MIAFADSQAKLRVMNELRRSASVTKRRVAVTGIGVISSIGCGTGSFWSACMEGRSGAVKLDNPWIVDTDLSTKIGCPVRDFDPETVDLPRRLTKILDRNTVFALACSHEALVDAGFGLSPSPDQRDQLIVGDLEPERLAVLIGSGIGGLTSLEASHGAWREDRSKKRVKRYALPMLIPNAPAGQVAIRFSARAECKAISTACAAGTMAIGDAFRLLVDGEADVAIAGGAEGFVDDTDGYGMLGFDRLRTMSRRNDDPQRASRPFDADRDGFVLGEGAAVLVLEREEHAEARGAKPYAYIVGYSANCDAGSMMALDESGRSIVRLVESGLASAGLSKADVGHINTHGTSTILNDRTEAKALNELFGPGGGQTSVTALKSMTGHGIGASGAIEAAALVLAYRHGKLPPTINYERPDPECDVDVVANEPREADPGVGLKLSYGFGGHNACLVFAGE